MRVVLLNLYPDGHLATYMLSSYVLKAYALHHSRGDKPDIDVLNFDKNESIDCIHDAIVARNPDLVGYSCYTWNIEQILRLIPTLRRALSPKTVHVMGGPEISLERVRDIPEESRCDYFVIGEGERRFLGLLEFLSRRDPASLNGLPRGIGYYESASIRYETDPEVICNLDEIPTVYSPDIMEDRLYARRQAFVETQRGCRFRCKYCVFHKHLPTINYYSVERVCSELDNLILNKRVYALRIFDPVFSSDLSRAKEIVRHLLELKESGTADLPLIYWSFSHLTVDEELIELIARLKLRPNIRNHVDTVALDRPQYYSEMLRDYMTINCVGIQSFCPDALRSVGRYSVNATQLATFMALVNRNNIVLKLDMILGLPGETLDSYFAGLELLLPYLRRTDHVLNLHLLQILPGSELEVVTETHHVRYEDTAPHYVISTDTLEEREMQRATKSTGLLFRAINSPMREAVFLAVERLGSLRALLKRMLCAIESDPSLADTQLVRSSWVDDLYWSDAIFRDIPSAWLSNWMANVAKQDV